MRLLAARLGPYHGYSGRGWKKARVCRLANLALLRTWDIELLPLRALKAISPFAPGQADRGVFEALHLLRRRSDAL
jgi:hypothetical protein